MKGQFTPQLEVSVLVPVGHPWYDEKEPYYMLGQYPGNDPEAAWEGIKNDLQQDLAKRITHMYTPLKGRSEQSEKTRKENCQAEINRILTGLSFMVAAEIKLFMEAAQTMEAVQAEEV